MNASLLGRVELGPLPSVLLGLHDVCPKDSGNRLVEWVVNVRCRHKQLNGQHDRADLESWTPFVLLQDVKADSTEFVDVWVVDFGPEQDLWWCHWVIFGQIDFQVECATFVDGAYRTLNRGVEVPEVGWVDNDFNAWFLGLGECLNLFVDSCRDHFINYNF